MLRGQDKVADHRRKVTTLRADLGEHQLTSLKAALWRPTMDDPLKQAKAKAAATYDAAADHFDDEPLSFWEHIGRRTVPSSDSRPVPACLMSAAGQEPQRCRPPKRSDHKGPCWELTWPHACLSELGEKQRRVA